MGLDHLLCSCYVTAPGLSPVDGEGFRELLYNTKECWTDPRACLQAAAKKTPENRHRKWLGHCGTSINRKKQSTEQRLLPSIFVVAFSEIFLGLFSFLMFFEGLERDDSTDKPPIKSLQVSRSTHPVFTSDPPAPAYTHPPLPPSHTRIQIHLFLSWGNILGDYTHMYMHAHMRAHPLEFEIS